MFSNHLAKGSFETLKVSENGFCKTSEVKKGYKT